MERESESTERVLGVSVNQDASCAAVVTRKGFIIYNIADYLEKRFCDFSEGMRIAEMLHVTSLLALVGSGDTPMSNPRTLRLWNSQKRETIYQNTFPSAVLSVRMNVDRLVACLETQIHIFELAQMICIQILNTSPNAQGLMALSDSESQLLAFPHGDAGDVVVYDCLAPRLLANMSAHKAPVVEMQFNRSGTLLATASVTGTVIRVFSVPSGEKLFSFRRGNRPSHIASIAFSEYSEFIAAGSSSGTVHVFSLEAAALGRAGPQVTSTAAAAGSGGAASTTAAPNSVTNSNTLRMADSFTSVSAVSDRKSVSGDGPGAADGESSAAAGSSNNVSSTWKDTLKSSTISALGYVQNWSFSAVSSLHVLPDHMQEFADSFRASSIARVPGAEGDFKLAIVGSASKAPSSPDLTGFNVVVITKNGCYYRFSVPVAVAPVPLDPAPCALLDEAVLDLN